VGLPTDIERLSLESNELQVVPPNQNVYALSLVMRNRAASAQAWPHIELTLNNDDEKAVVRRVFRPRDYLADPARSTAVSHPRERAADQAQLRAQGCAGLGVSHLSLLSVRRTHHD
jgi:hypothetical protein